MKIPAIAGYNDRALRLVVGFAEQVGQVGRAEPPFRKPGLLVTAPKEQVLAAEAAPFAIDTRLELGQAPRALQYSFLAPVPAPCSQRSHQLVELALREQRAPP